MLLTPAESGIKPRLATAKVDGCKVSGCWLEYRANTARVAAAIVNAAKREDREDRGAAMLGVPIEPKLVE